MSEKGKGLNKLFLGLNIALVLALVGLLVWNFIPKPTKAVTDVSIFVVWDESSLHIKPSDYDSDIVKDILEKNNDTLKISQEELSTGFITSVNNISGDWVNGFWWLIEVNYKAAEVGINELKVSNGDVITLRLVPSSYNPWE